MSLLSGELIGDIEMLERMAGVGLHGPRNDDGENAAITYAAWQATNTQWKAATDAMAADQPEPPVVAELEAAVEALCQRLAATMPLSTADCAALIAWVAHESGMGISDPTHTIVQGNVARFLDGLQPKPMLNQTAA